MSKKRQKKIDKNLFGKTELSESTVVFHNNFYYKLKEELL